MSNYYKRGDIIWVDFGRAYGHEQGGIRPAIIVQNNTGNKFSPCYIVLPLTTSSSKAHIPTQVYATINDTFNVIYGEQIRVVDKTRVTGYMTSIDDMDLVDDALRVSLAL